MEITTNQIIMAVIALIGTGGFAAIIVRLMDRGITKAKTTQIDGNLSISLVGASQQLLEDYRKDYDILRKRIDKLEEKNKNMSKRIDHLQIENDELEKENKQLKKRVGVLEEENHGLKKGL